MTMAPDESTTPLVELLQATEGAMPAAATVVVGGYSMEHASDLPWDVVAFGARTPDGVDEHGRPRDSATAIIALERARAGGARFLALPTPANGWLDELLLFGDHCRGRYPLVVDSELGAIFDLQPNASETQVHADTEGEESAARSAGEPLDAVDALAMALSRLVRGGTYSSEEFRRFEQRGVHVTPVHFYSPIPETAQLTEELWQRESELVGIDMNDAEQLRLVAEEFPRFRDEYEALPTSPSAETPSRFYLGNGLFDGTDALVLYCMLRHLQPRRVVEVGSGFSTRLAAQAAIENGSTEIVCVEPFPDAVLQEGFPGLTTLLPSRVEELPLDVFLDLGENDVLFIDSSHVTRTGGDVNFLYLEVLPRLKKGVVVQVHDVFLPREYSRDWVVDGMRFWNEQYLLQAFLSFNSAFEVLVANSYLQAKHPGVLRDTFPSSPWWGGGSFWIRRSA